MKQMNIHHKETKNTKPATEMRSLFCFAIFFVSFVTLW